MCHESTVNYTHHNFFELCNRPDIFGPFARTLLFSKVPRYFKWNKKNGCPARKAPQLMRAPAYSNQTLCTEYIQSIQDRLIAFVCNCSWLISPFHCHFKINAKCMDNSIQRIKPCTLLARRRQSLGRYDCRSSIGLHSITKSSTIRYGVD